MVQCPSLKTYTLCILSLDKFSLTSFSWQVFLDKFYLLVFKQKFDKFFSWRVLVDLHLIRTTHLIVLDKFSLLVVHTSKFPCWKANMTSFWTRLLSLSRKTCQVFRVHTKKLGKLAYLYGPGFTLMLKLICLFAWAESSHLLWESFWLIFMLFFQMFFQSLLENVLKNLV
jgi:hypothetical protein